jgi:antitoxin component YwqK of YwqJK toxin-antitoxin module
MLIKHKTARIMLEKKFYANGQAIFELSDDKLTYYYKNGRIKAEGPFINNMMEGEWTFYRETGQLWNTGGFIGNKKHGRWVRYDRNDKVEYDETFENGKQVKKGKK